jgi:hypothetical protein
LIIIGSSQFSVERKILVIILIGKRSTEWKIPNYFIACEGLQNVQQAVSALWSVDRLAADEEICEFGCLVSRYGRLLVVGCSHFVRSADNES